MKKQGTVKLAVEVTVKTAVKPITGTWDGTSAALPTLEAVTAAYALVKGWPWQKVISKTASHKVAPKVSRLVVAPEPAEQVERAVALSAKVAAKKLEPPTASPLHKALKKALFKYVQGCREDDGSAAHGYTHKDGRAALLVVTTEGAETWRVRYPDGAELAGTGDKPTTFEALAKVTNAKHEYGKETRAAKVARAVAKSPIDTSTLGAGAEGDDYVAPVRLAPEEVAGVSANVARAVEMLGSLTARRFDLDMLRGDKHYGHRLALLKRLLDREKVLVVETGINNLTEAFFSAIGAGEGCKAAKMECFAERCTDIDKRVRIAKAEAAKREKALKVLENRRTAVARSVPGIILPYPPELKLNRSQKKVRDAEEKTAAQKSLLAASPEQPAVPHPDAVLEPVCADLKLLAGSMANGADGQIVFLQMEKANSQGAICVYNNGRRVAAGVVALETLKTLRVVVGVDPADFAKQLLNPETPSVPVTSVAARHLTAVLKCCKESTTMAIKKFEAPATAGKKFEAKATVAKKAIKSEKPAKKAAKMSTEPKGERKSSLFRLKNETAKEWGAFTGQKGIIVTAFKKLGAVGVKAVGVTRAALITALPDVPAANISFYLSKWQEPKIVEKLAAAE
jgi:hypothetical protein